MVVKTSNEPIFSIIEGTSLQAWFAKFEVGNEIIYNLSLGFIVSIIFYLLVVWLPYRKKKIIIKNNFKNQYESFRKGMIISFLSASNLPIEQETFKKLETQQGFKEFFKVQVNDSQDRWHNVLNGLSDCLLKDILMEMELLLSETNYVLNNIEFNDEKVFVFFNELNREIYRFKNSSLDYNDVKQISSFIWSIFAGWSWDEGYRETDIIQEMIENI